MDFRSCFSLATWVAVLGALAACGAPKAAASAAAVPTDVTVLPTLDLDGYILMLGHDNSVTVLHLLDPATGKASDEAHLVHLADPHDVFAIAPDGQKVAWISLQKANGLRDVVVADVATASGVPSFHTLQTFPDMTADRIRWSPQGDRLYTRHSWLNLETGKAEDCAPISEQKDGSTIDYGIVPFFDGHLFACPDVDSLMDDGRRVANSTGTAENTSADGQWYYSDLHVPSLTNRPLDKNQEVDQFFSRQEQKFALPDGRWGMFLGGTDGKQVVEEVAGAGGFVTVKKVIESHSAPVDGTTWDVATAFAEDKHAPVSTWKFTGTLDKWLHDGDGRSWAPVAVSGDGKRVVFSIVSWKVVYDPKMGEPSNSPIDSAVAEVDAQGTVRGFRLSELGFNVQTGISPVNGRLPLLSLADGDWLAPAGSASTQTWVGFIDGKAVTIGDGGVVAQGGTLLLRQGPYTPQGFTVCTRTLAHKSLGPTQCIVQPKPGVPVAIVGQATKPSHASDPPLILGLNRRAGWPGSRVQLNGAHLGTSGKLMVGDLEVPKSAIVEWSDLHIHFTITDAFADDGTVRVTTAAGTAGDSQQFRLARTKLFASPFAQLPHAPHPVKQGLNLMDLGDLGAFTAMHSVELVVDPAAKLADGRYVVWSAGAKPPKVEEMSLTSGPYHFLMSFELQDEAAATDPWQMVHLTSGDLSVQRPRFVTIGGDLIEQASETHPLLDKRTTFAMAMTPGNQGSALPNSWQEVPGGALAVTHGFGMPAAAGWALRKLTGWIGADKQWGTAQYQEIANLPNYFDGAAQDGDTIVTTGADPMGAGGAAWQMSQDGGKTFAKVQYATDSASAGGFRHPLPVQAKAGTFFLVLDGQDGAAQITGVHGIGKDGTLLANVATLPPETAMGGGTVMTAPLAMTSHLGRAVVHFRSLNTLAMADFDTSPTAPQPWSVLPTAAAKGHVLSFWHDTQSHDLVVVLDDGQVLRATAAGGWTDFTKLDLGISLALPSVVKPLALGKMADGRWLVLAQVLAQDGKSPSPLGVNAWLVGKQP